MSVPTEKMLESTMLTLGWAEQRARRANRPDVAYLLNFAWRTIGHYMEQEVGDANEQDPT